MKMPNNKTNSETSCIESKLRPCLIRTFTDPDLYARLKKDSKISAKKNNFTQVPSLFVSTLSIFSNRSPASILNDGDDDVFLDNPEDSINGPSVRFHISSSSFTSISSLSSIQSDDNPEANLNTARRRCSTF